MFRVGVARDICRLVLNTGFNVTPSVMPSLCLPRVPLGISLLSSFIASAAGPSIR